MVVVACSVLFSCSPQPTNAPPDQQAMVQDTLDLLVSAIERQDRVAFSQQLSSSDPGFTRASAELFDNLVDLPLIKLELMVRGGPRPLAAGRRTVLTDAWVQGVTAVWQLGSDAGPATHELWWTFEAGGRRAVLAGVTDTPQPRAAQPIWLLEPLRVNRLDAVTVIESEGTYMSWAPAAATAVTEARARLRPAQLRRWNGQVVLEVPNSKVHFRQIIGLPADTQPELAAIAFPEGPDPGTAALRIVVDPDVMNALDTDQAGLVMMHEITHVLTHAADSPAPLWLVEGYADWMGYDVYRSAQADAEAIMIQQVRRGGVPEELPDADRFRPGAAQINLVYAQSWLVCRYIADTYSDEDLGEFYLEMDRGQSLEVALDDILGLTRDAFTDGWRSYIARLAK